MISIILKIAINKLILLIGFISPVETFLEKGQEITLEMIIINLYVHFVITIILLIELFMSEREIIKINRDTIIINSFIITIIVEKYFFKFYPYLFLENINVLGMIITFFSIYGLLIGSIFIFKAVSNRINKNNTKNKKNREDEQSIDYTINKVNVVNIVANEEE